jgi:hypothetical protein
MVERWLAMEEVRVGGGGFGFSIDRTSNNQKKNARKIKGEEKRKKVTTGDGE